MVRPATPLGPIGLILPTFAQDTVPTWAEPSGGPGGGAVSEITSVCRRAEELGAGALWTCDHLFWHGPCLECMVVLSIAATATDRALLGTCVIQLPLRQAPVVATQADGWMPLFLSAAEYRAALERLAKEVDRVGREAGEVTPSIVLFVSIDDDAGVGRRRGTGWMSSLYGIPAQAFDHHLVAGTAAEVADVVTTYRDAGAEHVAVYITADEPLEQFERLTTALSATGVPTRGYEGRHGPHRTHRGHRHHADEQAGSHHRGHGPTGGG